MWIRDGVLVNRMHVNAVAFAVSYVLFADQSQRSSLEMEDLINFGFEKSGISCAEKIFLYNDERQNALAEDLIADASDSYNQLATQAAKSCTYFAGALELLKDMEAVGARHFITSAVQQPILDAWLQSQQGASAAPYLTEVLGQREDSAQSARFAKGRAHFAHVRKQLPSGQPILYVADAVSEISAGAAERNEFNLVPIGFGYVVAAEDVLLAFELVQSALNTILAENCSDTVRNTAASHARTQMCENPSFFALPLKPGKLALPSAEQVETSLRQAGADAVAMGNCDQIMGNLREILRDLLVARLV